MTAPTSSLASITPWMQGICSTLALYWKWGSMSRTRSRSWSCTKSSRRSCQTFTLDKLGISTGTTRLSFLPSPSTFTWSPTRRVCFQGCASASFPPCSLFLPPTDLPSLSSQSFWEQLSRFKMIWYPSQATRMHKKGGCWRRISMRGRSRLWWSTAWTTTQSRKWGRDYLKYSAWRQRMKRSRERLLKLWCKAKV